jgi:hypothetical protein
MRLSHPGWLAGAWVLFLCIPALAQSTAPTGKPPAARPSPALQRDIDAFCGPGAGSIEDMTAKLKSRSQLVPFILDSEVTERAFADYYACQSLIPGRGASCDQLKGLVFHYSNERQGHNVCREQSGSRRLALGVFRGGDTTSACRDYLADGGAREEDLPRICGILAGAAKNGRIKDAVAGLMAAKLISAEEAASSAKDMVYFEGRPERCGAKDDCRLKARFFAAVRSGDAAACAADPFCKALSSRDAEACAPFRAAAKKSTCAAVAKMQAEQEALAARDKAAKAAAAALTAKQMENVTTKKPLDPATAALKEKAAKEEAAAKAAALKRSAAELAMRERVLAEKVRRAEARRVKAEPPRQFRPGQKQNDIPASVMKRMEEIERRSQAVPPAQPAGPAMPGPQPPTP